MRKLSLWATLVVAVGVAFGLGWWLGRRPLRGGLWIPDPRPSLFFIPMERHLNASEGGARAAAALADFLDRRDPARLDEARRIYREIIPRENFGGEYTALDWLAGYLRAGPEEQARLRANPDGRRLVEALSPDGWAPLGHYLRQRYVPGELPDSPERFRFVDELLRFNDPRRAEWEHTDRVLEALELAPGMAVADVGAGAGYFSFRIADKVGPTGRVVATEIFAPHVEYIRQVAAREGLRQLTAVRTGALSEDTFTMESLDRVFLCSTYQAIYASTPEPLRDRFIGSVERALRPDGLLVVADNEAVVRRGVVPYRGISISKHLVIAQLRTYGFRLVRQIEHIPQRYVLVFRHERGRSERPHPPPRPRR